MRALLILGGLLLGLPVASGQPLDYAGYQRLFAAESLGLAAPEESLRISFTRNYRGVMPHGAFAFAQDAAGRSAWSYTSGRPTPEEARQGALRSCQQRQEARGVQAECRVLAEDGAIAGHTATLPPQEGSLGPFRWGAFHWRHGPEAARGVVIWAHGLAGNRADLRGSNTAGVVTALNDAGWDVLRHDRFPTSDELTRTLPELMDGLAAVRAAGYRQIVLAGQSRGAWQSLMAAARSPEGVVAVVALAPARHGDWQSRNNSLSAGYDDFRQLIAALPPNGPRVMVALFDGDDFDPDPEARASLVARRAEDRSSATLAFWPQGGLRGHGAGYDWRFSRDAAGCVLALVAGPDAAVTRGLRRDACR